MPGFLLLVVFLAGLRVGFADTNPLDAAVMISLMSQWQNTPPNWGQSNDPCGVPWDGVLCSNSSVIALRLSTMGLKGTLSGDIAQLSQLQSLDLSFNPNLRGPLNPSIGNLKHLSILILSGCSFSGPIPQELGNLQQLTFLALDSNNFSGPLPASLGRLSNLFWFDVGNNQLTGGLPVSSPTSPGLDQLINTKHFHFDNNNLSGPIPANLFSSANTLLHIIIGGNQFTGPIPNTIGLITSLEALRLDRNSFNGSVPTNIKNLTSLNELNLANNKLTGPIPDLTGMRRLNYVDLSNNTFDSSETPSWFSTIDSLTALVIEHGNIHGPLPQKLFSFPQLQQVLLDNNAINGTLDMGSNISPQLNTVNLENNNILSYNSTNAYKNVLILVGNPACINSEITNSFNCRAQQSPVTPYSTSLAKCGSTSCPLDQSLSPLNCSCAYPYTGVIFFRAPRFRDDTNVTLFQGLETSLWTQLRLTNGSIIVQNPFFDSDNYLEVRLKIFPSTGMYFDWKTVQSLGFQFSNHTYKSPAMFGTYFFIASPYPFPVGNGKGGGTLSTGAVAGIAVGCIVLLIGLIVLGIYAFQQKRRAERALELGRPFASWVPGSTDAGDAPQLKGARWFSFEELKTCTNNFSEANEIGSGGYGRVYRGTISSGQVVAIKRAEQGSMQGALEFKTEIELLSRLHHKNLVGLVGFCYEQKEQMLIYEFIPNGTLRESLSGKSGIKLDWRRRLKVALDSARGIAYLHDLADPPIIHRDIKSTNILLDENLTAKVADFGLSKQVSDAQKGHVSTQVKGTLGYLDPEYYMTQQLTDKSDVYSFGVVMLELITSKQPLKKGKYIVREVRMALDTNDEEYYGLKVLMDPLIQKSTNIGFRRFVKLAMQCVEESAAKRPSMNEVVKGIETLLHASNPNSASSSATDFVKSDSAPQDLYSDLMTKGGYESSNAFNYSGGYALSAKIEPK